MRCLNVHHVGIWADDVAEMVSFLTDVLGFGLVTRQSLDPGERVFVHLGGDQMFEILSVPQMQPRPDIPAHMAAGSTPAIGVPHVCLRVTELPAWEERIRAAGYRVNNRWPPEGGYGRWELGATRTIWFTGPSGVDFELFEFDEEYPFGGRSAGVGEHGDQAEQRPTDSHASAPSAGADLPSVPHR